MIIITGFGDPGSRRTGTVGYAELHSEVVSLYTLAESVVCGVTLPLDELSLLADGGAVLAALAPVPLLSKAPLRTRSAHGGRVRRAVTFHRCAWGTLITQQELRGHGVTVLVPGGFVVSPGEGHDKEL